MPRLNIGNNLYIIYAFLILLLINVLCLNIDLKNHAFLTFFFYFYNYENSALPFFIFNTHFVL
jgi:hypothetical protein